MAPAAKMEGKKCFVSRPRHRHHVKKHKKRVGWQCGFFFFFFFPFKHYKNRKQRRKHLTGGEGEVGADTPTKARLTTYFIYCLRYARTLGFTQL